MGGSVDETKELALDFMSWPSILLWIDRAIITGFLTLKDMCIKNI